MTYDVDNSAPYANPAGTPPQENPGKTLGIVGLVLGIVGFFLAFLGPIAGLIVSIIGRNKSKKVGQKNGLATAGIIVSIVALLANIVVLVIVITVAASIGTTAVDLLEQCQSDPTGTVTFQGQQISCEDLLAGTY